MKTLLDRLCVSFVLAASCVPLAAAPTAANSVADFYRGKQITMVVEVLGGGYGLAGRLIVENMGRHIPGHPSMILVAKPGGGGRTSVNYLYNVLPRDGTAIGFVHKDVASNSLLEPKGVKYDTLKFQWIGSIAPMNTAMFVWHTAPAKTLEEMKRIPVTMGADGVAHPTAIFPTLFNNVLGTRFKVVSGYRGSQDIFLAMERGEVAGTVFSWETIRSRKPDWIAKKLVVPIAQVSLEKDQDLPNVPLLADLVKSPADRELVKFLVVGSKVGRAIAAPPGVPADRMAALRKAFDETMKDPAFLAMAKKSRMEVSPTPGIEVQKLVAKYARTPPAEVARARKLIGLKD